MYERHIKETVGYIRDRFHKPIDVAIILGSGLDTFADLLQDRIVFYYRNVPHFHDSGVEGHESLLMFGYIGSRAVMVMSGRQHYYEGRGMDTVTFPIRVIAALGIKTLILTCASGAIREDLNAGSIVLIKDHISLFAPSPLRGENLDTFGPRFPDMSHIYDEHLRNLVKQVASEHGIKISEAVYNFYQGPQYETPADVRALRVLGADVCGMSVVPEAIVAVHSGVKVIGFSLVTNKAAGLSGNTLSHEEVLTVSKRSALDINTLIYQTILNL
ncbi:MAG: purine-nucleoside phosphorylase [Erysipelotrichaceae bacterium]|nr:purine-nucleoside phosphorylase [Erysipelotrichaceae bacterium]